MGRDMQDPAPAFTLVVPKGMAQPDAVYVVCIEVLLGLSEGILGAISGVVPLCHASEIGSLPPSSSLVHCWDYRRFVAAQADVAPAEELAFTDSLITRNFSNYSSWHYRSCLLPQLHPQPDNCLQGLLKGLTLVQNAFFTDPNDQRAWFYHHWLLGQAEPHDVLCCLQVSWEEACLSVLFHMP